MPGRNFPKGRASRRAFPRPPRAQTRRPSGLTEGRGRRRPLLAAGGVAIVLACGALGAVVANRAPRPVVLLAVAHRVPAGVPVTASDLETVSVAPVAGLDAIPLLDAGQVIGRRAAEELEPGSLLVPAELSPQQGLPADVALIGTSLAVDQMPAELTAGERVLVVLSGTNGVGSSLATDTASAAGGTSSRASVPSPTGPPGSVLCRATVISVSSPVSSSGLAGTPATTSVATLEVPEAAAGAVTAASAAGDVSLAVVGGSDDGAAAP